MTDDLVKRLTDHIAVFFDDKGHVFENEILCDEAADRIEELEAKLAKATVALVRIAGNKTYADDPWTIARTALVKMKGDKQP
jgi:hypothetical protein